jgi:hypothetical protein
MDSQSTETAQKIAETHTYSPSISHGTVNTKWEDTIAELKYAFCTKDGWIGDYVRSLYQ